jgi:hypothetical protein
MHEVDGEAVPTGPGDAPPRPRFGPPSAEARRDETRQTEAADDDSRQDETEPREERHIVVRLRQGFAESEEVQDRRVEDAPPR